ncbi:MAG: LysM peptidoglycan-binding domain-containing protein [Steroidobacteraceae bacterium]
MFSNQSVSSAATWSRVAAFACAALAAACSSPDTTARPEPPQQEYVAPESAEPASDQDLTATEAATVTNEATPAAAPAVTADSVRADAPSRYTVKRGDTLWDISNLFLRDPWLWPEIWYVNPQVENPHLIYPGDVLALAYAADGTPRIMLEQGGAARLNPRLRSTPADGPIATIPYSAIARFLSRPSLLAAEQMKKAPYVLAFRDEHMIGGTGEEIYVRNLDAPLDARYAVVHPGQKLRDPESGDVLGYEGVYAATARVSREGNPLTAQLTDAARETLEGDVLIANDADVPLTFEVRIPNAPVRGSIISVVDDTTLIGTYQIIAVNRGTRHGLAPGHILAVDQAGLTVRDKGRRSGNSFFATGSSFDPKVKLPNERAGTALVFKTYERMSYAIVVGASHAIRVADTVRTP